MDAPFTVVGIKSPPLGSHFSDSLARTAEKPHAAKMRREHQDRMNQYKDAAVKSAQTTTATQKSVTVASTTETKPQFIKPIKEDGRKLLSKCKSAGQRAVLKSLFQMEMAVEKYGGSVGDIKLRRSALIYGMSGAGKSWLSALFSKFLGMPHYSTTVGSWAPRGSRGKFTSIAQILNILEDGPACIVVDECDKFSGKGEGPNASYFRAILDEIMSLAMASLDDFKPSAAAIENLNKSWLLFCGTWQDLYKNIENPELRRISPEDLINYSGLPDELINRTGQLLELVPPQLEEFVLELKKIEQGTGIFLSDDARHDKAMGFIRSRKGFRGLQEVALELAIRGVVEKVTPLDPSQKFPIPTAIRMERVATHS